MGILVQNENAGIVRKCLSEDGSTKYVLLLSDGSVVEAVYIPEEGSDIKLCISSQIGCTNKCAYCATGAREYIRDMTSDEIVSQVSILLDDNGISAHECNIGVLFMGMGEAFFNYDSIIAAIEVLHSRADYRIPLNKIIVSTSGVVPKIAMFARDKFRTRLAVSLNACNDDLRNRLMPINKVYPLNDLLLACISYTKESGDSVIFEYVLISGVNDSIDDLSQLINTARGIKCEIQLIPYNVTAHVDFCRSSESTIGMFHRGLNDAGVHTSIKASYGVDIYGGCGQLGIG